MEPLGFDGAILCRSSNSSILSVDSSALNVVNTDADETRTESSSWTNQGTYREGISIMTASPGQATSVNVTCTGQGGIEYTAVVLHFTVLELMQDYAELDSAPPSDTQTGAQDDTDPTPPLPTVAPIDERETGAWLERDTGTEDASGGQTSTLLVVGVSVGGGVAIAGAAVATVLVLRRRKAKREVMEYARNITMPSYLDKEAGEHPDLVGTSPKADLNDAEPVSWTTWLWSIISGTE